MRESTYFSILSGSTAANSREFPCHRALLLIKDKKFHGVRNFVYSTRLHDNPSRPWDTISGIPPTGVTMTGSPKAIASSMDMGQPFIIGKVIKKHPTPRRSSSRFSGSSHCLIDTNSFNCREVIRSFAVCMSPEPAMIILDFFRNSSGKKPNACMQSKPPLFCVGIWKVLLFLFFLMGAFAPLYGPKTPRNTKVTKAWSSLSGSFSWILTGL